MTESPHTAAAIPASVSSASTNGLRIVDLRSQQKGQIKIVDQQGRHVANVLARHPDCEDHAYRFAAAPDLLDVVEEIIAYRGGANSALEDEYVMDRARAAIAKARGNV